MPILTILLLFIAACAPAKSLSGVTAVTQPAATLASPQVPNCNPAPIIVPSLPSVIPGIAELDPVTGLHMTGTPQVIDLPSYRLLVTGLVEQPLSLKYDDLRCLPKVTASPELICPGSFSDTASWSGVPIAEVLKLARPKPEAQTISLISADGYQVPIDLNMAMDPKNFLAYELEGQPLPVLHGFPLRAVLPGTIGGEWVKWLVEINVNEQKIYRIGFLGK